MPHDLQALHGSTSALRIPTLIAALTLSAGLCTSTALAQDLNEEGWTVIEPSVDTRFVFVSSSDGSDFNSGLTPSRPVKTLERAEEMVRDGHPDWILLKRGDTWNDGFGTWGWSGRSAEERVVISSYGDADERPRIELHNNTFVKGRINDDVSHVAIIGLSIIGDRDPGDLSIGIRWLSLGENLLIEDCYIDGFKDNIVIQASGGTYQNIGIRRNVIVDSWSTDGHSQGMYIKSGDGVVIEENIFDHNGWDPTIAGADASTFDQNVYLQTDTYGVEFHGNLSAHAGAAGVQIRAGGNASYNLLYANPFGMRFGYDELEWPAQAASGSIFRNVVLGGEISEPDRVTSGVGIWVERVDGVQVRDNVVAHFVEGGMPRAFTLNGYAGDVLFKGNVAHDFVNDEGQGYALKTSAEVQGSATFDGNRWFMPGTGRLIKLRYSDRMSFVGNDMSGFSNDDDVFQVDGSRIDYSEWVDQGFVTNDTIDSSSEGSDEGPDLDDYANAIGFDDADAMIEAARAMSRSNWDHRLTGRAAATWITTQYLGE